MMRLISDWGQYAQMRLSILLTVAVLVSVGCAPERNSKSPTHTKTFSEALGNCQSQRPEAFQKILQLAQQYRAQITWTKQLERLNKEAARMQIITVSRPELLARAQALLDGPFSMPAAAQMPDFLSLAEIEEKIIRLEFMECNIGHYWNQGLIPFEAYASIDLENPSLKHAVNLCSAFYARAVCQAEASIALSQNTLARYIAHYMQRFEDTYFSPRFELLSTLPFASCKQTNDGVEIEIAARADRPQDFSRLQSSLEKWRSQDGSVQVTLRSSNEASSLEIVYRQSGPAHVNMNNRSQIILAPGHDSQLILAHELGHILGFPDCYYEAWSRDKKAFVYIELDPLGDNLMCTLRPQASIPEYYFDQLKRAYCH